MPTIEVLAAGPLTTIQDLGRGGCGRIGISRGGAADPLALRAGNLLVGNSEEAAGLEMTLVGGTFRFDEAAVVAVTGADFGPALDDRPLPTWEACEVRSGQILKLGPTRSGARAYLVVRGGLSVPPTLGSASTHLLGGLGGLEGRALRAGDRLGIAAADESRHGFSGTTTEVGRLDPDLLAWIAPRVSHGEPTMLRVTHGPQAPLFADRAHRTLSDAPYTVLEESNRIGLRLRGALIPPPLSGRMVTEGVPLGAIQITPAWQPILLFVDHQTTGGYPVLASVISADLPRVGQLRPRDEVRFEAVTLEAARALLKEQEASLRSMFLP